MWRGCGNSYLELYLILTATVNSVIYIYYLLEESRGKYWVLGVFLLQYFPLVRI